MHSNKTSRRGNLRENRRAAKGGSISRDNTQLTMSTQQTRASKRKGSVAMKNLEEELKKTMPKGWNIRDGFQVSGGIHSRDFLACYIYS